MTYGESLVLKILVGIRLGFESMFEENFLMSLLKKSDIEPIWISRIEAEAFAVSEFVRKNNLIEKANNIGKELIKNLKGVRNENIINF